MIPDFYIFIFYLLFIKLKNYIFMNYLLGFEDPYKY
jgi:hypothetical protein